MNRLRVSFSDERGLSFQVRRPRVVAWSSAGAATLCAINIAACGHAVQQPSQGPLRIEPAGVYLDTVAPVRQPYTFGAAFILNPSPDPASIISIRWETNPPGVQRLGADIIARPTGPSYAGAEGFPPKALASEAVKATGFTLPARSANAPVYHEILLGVEAQTRGIYRFRGVVARYRYKGQVRVSRAPVSSPFVWVPPLSRESLID